LRKFEVGQILKQHELKMEDFLKWIEDYPMGTYEDGSINYYCPEVDIFIRLNTEEEDCVFR